MTVLQKKIPVTIAYIADGEPSTLEASIVSLTAVDAVLISPKCLKNGLKIGLVVKSGDERVQTVFRESGLVSRPFSELRTQALVNASEESDADQARIYVQFIGNLRVAEIAAR